MLAFILGMVVGAALAVIIGFMAIAYHMSDFWG